MYEIRPESVKTFITDNSIKLPRFQRKQTWDEKKNFQLCISVFKDYPMGVCILNLEGSGEKNLRKYLLDGRQRRNALKTMYENPEVIGMWANKYLGASKNIDEYDLQELFYEKINDYLELDEDTKTSTESDEAGELGSSDEETDIMEENESENQDDDIESDGDEVDSYIGGLDLLFHIIKLTHKRNKHSTEFSKVFDYEKLLSGLPYIDLDEKNTYVINGKKLKSFIDEYQTHCSNEYVEPDDDPETFFKYVLTRGNLKDNSKKNNLKVRIQTDWNSIVDRIRIINNMNQILTNSKIGLIEVKDYGPADSQKIFNIINSEGVKLTAVEVLSASMSWSRQINNPTQDSLTKVKELYMNMNPTYKPQGVCKWDIPATLLSRLDDNIIFKKMSWDIDKSKTDFETKLTLGFKLLSGIYEKGIKKENIESLGKNSSVDWGTGIENTISDLKQIIKLIEQIDYFSYFKSWNKSFMEITSDTIAINFFLLMYFDWKRKGSPIGNSAKTSQFQKNAFLLWDQLIYEYVTKQWRGSGDSKIAANIRSINDKSTDALFTAVESDKWQTLLDEIYISATIDGTPVSAKILEPVLYHMYCLKCISGPDFSGPDKCTVEVDHILPQAIVASNPRKDYITHNLYNLGLLPKKTNISKGDKRLNDITNAWLQDQIVHYEFIDKNDFDKYSNISNYQDLFKNRKAIFDEAFDTKRKEIIDN